MPNLNQVQLAGHLARDPELRFTANGTQVCEFSMAINYEYGNTKETAWVRVKCWKGWAESAAQLKKGQAVMVIGRIATPEWEKDGKKQSRTEIVASSLYALPKGEPAPSARQEAATPARANSGPAAANPDLGLDDDDTPPPF